MRYFLTLLILSSICAEEPTDSPTRTAFADAVRAIAVKKTKVDGMRMLVLLGGQHLFFSSSMVLVTDDRVADEVGRQAKQLLYKHKDPESVRALLVDPNPRVKLWAVMACGASRGEEGPWLPLIPLLLEMAAHDSSASIRSHAVERLSRFGQQDALEKLVEQEHNPWVLKQLIGFSGSESRRLRWYQRAIRELASDDANNRQQWLSYIYGNVWNPSTASMWRIEPNPELISALEIIASSDFPIEADLAKKTVTLLREQKSNTEGRGKGP